MTELPKRQTFHLAENFERQISKLLSDYGLRISDSRKIAECVKRLSDFFIDNPLGETPWKESWAQIAYISYFAPLNFLRNQAVVAEAKQRNFFHGLETLTDFGAGLGSAAWAINEQHSFKKTTLIEKAEACRNLQTKFLSELNFSQQATVKSDPPQKALCSFSYSLTELKALPKWALQFEALMIVEPSTRDDGRKLGDIRNQLIQAGYSIIAPCTHQKACPLLTQSKTDWCHDRIHIELPEWMQDVEKNLPFKNQTLTMSYLLARKKDSFKTQDLSNFARLVGDALVENGKTRQLHCRGENREFIAWMHRHFPKYPGLDRGILLNISELALEEKGLELRVKKSSET
ncbi:MAG: small ribosomal subunit Rsm22 family protein [Pseudobdellovibrionaceae bacterium]